MSGASVPAARPPAGEPLKAAVSEADFIPRAEVEDIVQSLTATLEARVKARTNDLRAANERLLQEIDDRRAAEERLRESEELYRYTVELSHQLAWTAGSDGRLLSVSRRMAEVMGMRGKPVPHDRWLEIIHPDDREHLFAAWDGALRSKQASTCEFRMRVADGSYRTFHARAAPRLGKNGDVIRWYGFTEDVHDQKLAEQKRQKAEEEVRRMQSELIHVSRLSAMGTMGSTLAHELNQPLTAVTNFVRGSRKLLEATPKPQLDKVREALLAAENGALKAGQIVRRLRELVARGTARVQPEELPKLIEDASVLAFVDAKLLGVSYRTETDPKARWVEADSIQIQQVLINLIRNAVQAVQSEERREILISTFARGSTVETSIADTGPGISADVRDALFSPFHSTKTDGLGIGLSISRTIVESHGGKIWAEDRAGGGTIFRFTLPKSLVPEANR